MIDAQRIDMIIQEGEGLTVEFKEHFSPRIVEDVTAFVNTKGGVIILGVRDDKTIVGEELTNDLKGRINSLGRNCSPPIQTKIRQVKNLVVIDVPQGDEKPYGCGAGYFRRLDGTTQKMSNHELRIMFREHELISFEEMIHREVAWQDISRNKIKIFLKEADIRIKKIVAHDILTSFNVAHNDKITNAGVLFFAENPRKFILQAQMTMIAFKGKDRIHIFDRQDIQDDLLTQFNGAVFFLKKHLNRRSEIKGVNREDIYEIPIEALREAIANAIIHRDYGMRGTSLMVEVYDDRVEIVNPGGLPAGLEKKDFGKISVRRNERIADLFFRMDKVELAGTGIRRMREAMITAGLPPPRIRQTTFFNISFKRPPLQDAADAISLKESAKRRGVGGVEKGVEKGVENLSANEKKIYTLIEKNPSISKGSMAKKGNLTKKTVEYNLEKLKARGFIKRIGPARGGHWKVVVG
jgi:ATP-dependent DNA helicase RecG